MDRNKPYTREDSKRLAWLELIKASALVWIFLNHVAEQLFGYPLIANPSASWPPLAERIAQLAPLSGYGIWNLPANMLRYLGWLGDQGVQLFLITSGFGLTWGLLKRSQAGNTPIWDFYRRRAGRIYPLWWGAHILFAALWLITSWGLSPISSAFFLSLLGVRLTPALLYYFSPAWWYFGLLLQLYLLYPLLWLSLKRMGSWRLLIYTCIVAFVIRGVGALVFEGYLDAWLRGAIFITRLPEFTFGISLAAWMQQSPTRVDRRLKAPSTMLIAALAYLLGLGMSLTLPGMVIAPFIVGVSVFILLYAVFSVAVLRTPGRALRPGIWMGQHSYSLYLMHHIWILLLVPVGVVGLVRTSLGVGGAALMSLGSAVFLEWGVGIVQNWWRTQLSARGLLKTLVRLAMAGTILGTLLVGAELLVRQVAPQEVLGWGERPSLEPDEAFGWKLKPSQETRLRWEGYDYSITANRLGFPGPEYPQEKVPGIYRILVTGDAFTSAEGVDTSEAWPRHLEVELNEQVDQEVQVLNFAITGYGPNQYSAVVKEYAPRYKPDLILVQLFVNDYQDVLLSNTYFQESIGFHLPDPQSFSQVVRLEHLQRLLRLRVIEPVSEILRDKPRDHGYFIGNYQFMERDYSEMEEEGKVKVQEQLEQIKSVAEQVGAVFLVIMVPAPIQVCETSQLAYAPKNINLSDASRYDQEIPQRMMEEITSELNIPLHDLRPVLRAAQPDCLYRSDNMHWTAEGHQKISDYISTILLDVIQLR